MTTAQLIICLAIAVYLIAMLGVGVWFAKKNNSVDDFYLGGLKLGPFVTAMSAEASDMSSWLLMGIPGLAYFCGISDLSYCGGMDKEELAAYAAQTPLWGSAYAMDIEAMAKLKIPSMLFGPWGKDIHTRWERVNKASLYEKTPAVLKNFIEQMFDK